MSRSDLERILDILECIEAIRLAEATRDRYAHDADVAQVAADAVQRRVFTIGEAVKALSDETTSAHPEVPWSRIARMRDLIGHHYYKLDHATIHATIDEPLRELGGACSTICTELEGET